MSGARDARERAVIDATPKGLFIGGRWLDTSSGFDVEDPATAHALCQVADAGPDDAAAALDAAVAAAADFAAVAPRERGEVADEFIDKLATRMKALTLGRGTDEGVDMGPLIDHDQRETTSRLVDDAVQRGATIVIGGHALDRPGYFYAPTILTDIPADAELRDSGLFAPVAPIHTFASEEQALHDGNDTAYGLVSYLYTRDLNRAVRVGEALQTGMVGINTGLVSNPQAPFGGVKQSGYGREGGHEGMDEYLDTRYLAIGLD